jgi:hypothetical protein
MVLMKIVCIGQFSS